jgi:CRP/FNR family transcriptional regulator, cyclic AMP receptor protein
MKHVVVDPELAAAPLLEGLSRRQLELVSQSVTRLTLSPGRVVAREGRRGNEFMVLLDGTVEVRHVGRVVATRGRCDYIGEIALLTGRPRTATVVATSPVTLDVIGRREFLALIDVIPQVSERVRATMPGRIAELAA